MNLLPEQFKQPTPGVDAPREEPSFDHRTGNDGSGYYIRTFTGRKLYWASVEDHDYCIEDIAHALANKCRWSGHTNRFYSIAQHSVFVSWYVPHELRLAALLHDAAEAYMPDFPSPLKWYLLSQGFTQLKMIEKRVAKGIERKFGLTLTDDAHKIIKVADTLALSTEHRDLMPKGGESDWMGEPAEETLEPQNPALAEEQFLLRFKRITGPVGKYEDIRHDRA